MSSQPTSTRSALCQHPIYRVGCLSCFLHDTKLDLQEANVQLEKRAADMQACRDDLATTDLSPAEKKRLTIKLATVSNEHKAWHERSALLADMIISMELQIKQMCADTSDSIPEVFESQASEREAEYQGIWCSAARSEYQTEFMKFRLEDPSRRYSYEGLDHSSIPATPDALLSDGTGLLCFLRAGKLIGRQYTQALGEDSGPAIMNYGAALNMFGGPDGPNSCIEPTSSANIEEAKEPSSATPSCDSPIGGVSIEDSMAQCTLSRPRTELEYRREADIPPTVADLSNEDQAALFKSGKFMADVSRLACEYVNLHAAAEKAATDKKAQTSASSASAAVAPASPAKETLASGWPAVEGLDWNGFTNWIHHCKKTDAKFGQVTLPKWRTEENDRHKTVVELLSKWEAPKNFEDGSSRCGKPSAFFPSDVSLAKLDMEKMGIKVGKKSR